MRHYILVTGTTRLRKLNSVMLPLPSNLFVLTCIDIEICLLRQFYVYPQRYVYSQYLWVYLHFTKFFMPWMALYGATQQASSPRRLVAAPSHSDIRNARDTACRAEALPTRRALFSLDF